MSRDCFYTLTNIVPRVVRKQASVLSSHFFVLNINEYPPKLPV
ncbi:hypothetical protein SAMN04515620_14127 [Collimonas sp. OK607]|nr:hypothetical protein SAMN04515620_14127 [Collimonas sp. OK607]